MSWFRALCLLAIGAVFLVSGCGKSPDIPVIASGAEYSDQLDEAERLSRTALEKYEQGEPLTKSETENLRLALKKFEGLIAFMPDRYGAYFGAAKIQMALKEPEKAYVHFRSFVALTPPNPDEQFKPAIAEAHYCLATLQEEKGEFDYVKLNAERAVELFPGNPNYLTLLASVRLRENSELLLRSEQASDAGKLQEANELDQSAKALAEEAHKLVDRALAIDPRHGRAKQLHAMMLHE